MNASNPPRASVEIRPLVESDQGDWLRLWRGYQNFYQVEIAPDVSRVTWLRLLDRSEPMHGAVAVAAGKTIGLVHYIYHRSCWTTGNYCYLQDLFVASDVRGQGTGRALIEYVYKRARAAGCSRVHWLTHESNKTAMLLYDRIAERPGFVQYRHKLS
jgi:GNAT superfamily N-acetyltransferase